MVNQILGSQSAFQIGQASMVNDHEQAREMARMAGVHLVPTPGAFDGYHVTDVPLGDLMRGERATLGKSLLDVERELKIRAAFIAAIENGDVGAFSSPGFIPGYVRSYARYLGMEPEWTFQRFCAETGYAGVFGDTSRQARGAKRVVGEAPPRQIDPNDVISNARISFAPKRDSLFSGIEPGALGSVAVLVVVAAGLAYGAWAVLHDIQRLTIAPIDEAPLPLAQLDPLSGATGGGAFDMAQAFDAAVPAPDTLGRLYRPEALEAPVLTPRDGALATLDPDEIGTLGGYAGAPGSAVVRTAGQAGAVAALTTDPQPETAAPVQVTAARTDEVVIFAVRPSWVRVTSASGATLFEGTLNRGDSYTVAAAEVAPRLRSGNAGSVYFAVNGVTMGPAGAGATIARDIELSADAVSTTFAMADPVADPDLSDVVALVLGLGAEGDAP